MIPKAKYAVPSIPENIDTNPIGVNMKPKRKKVTSVILDFPSFVFQPFMNIKAPAAKRPINIVVKVDCRALSKLVIRLY